MCVGVSPWAGRGWARGVVGLGIAVAVARSADGALPAEIDVVGVRVAADDTKACRRVENVADDGGHGGCLYS